MSQVEQHDDEEKHDHDGAGVHEHLHDADELRVEQHVERRQAEHRVHQPQCCGHGTPPGHETDRGDHGDEAEEIDVKDVEEGQLVVRHYSPFGAAGSHSSHTGCVCAMNRSTP